MRTGSIEDLLRQVADHERRLNHVEKRIGQLRIDGSLRWDVQPAGGGTYQISIVNEATGGTVVVGVI